MSCCCCESDMRHLRFFRKPPGRDAHGERGYVASRPGQSARFVVQLLVRASRLLLWAGATVVAVSLRTNLEPAQAHLRPSMMARPAPHHRPVNVCRHADRRAVQLPSRRESLDRTTIFHPWHTASCGKRLAVNVHTTHATTGATSKCAMVKST